MLNIPVYLLEGIPGHRAVQCPNPLPDKPKTPPIMEQTPRPTTSPPPHLAGDGLGAEAVNPFHVTYSPGLAAWMAENDLSIAFTTYTAGKLVLAGPGRGGTIAVSERNFGQAMALRTTDSGLYLSTKYQVWRFENGLDAGRLHDGWDRLYMPRRCEITGNVDVHDIHIDRDGRLLVAVTAYNCLAQLDGRASFSPLWRPPFIDAMVNEDRCHLNGFCLEDGRPAYATVIAPTNTAGAWRDRRADGGQVIDLRDDSTLADGLAMPHTPRLYRDRLYLLEAGSGWFGTIDRKAGRFERIAWCPGFLRGLAFFADYAVVGLSKPRNKVFAGLPLDGELENRGQEPECALYVLRLSDGALCHKLTITGSVEEIYDTAFLPGTQQPLLVGLEGEEIGKYVAIGPDNSVRPRDTDEIYLRPAEAHLGDDTIASLL